MTNTAEFLQEQKRLTEAATPGPWRLGSFGHGPNAIVRDAEGLATVQDVWVCDADAGRPENAEFIAAARSSVPKLIAAVEAVMEALAFGDELDKTAHEYINPTARRLQIANRVLNRIEQRIEAALGGEGE